MLLLKGVYVAGCVEGIDDAWVRQLHTCGVYLEPVTEAGAPEAQLLIAPQERVNALLPRYPQLQWVHLIDKGAELVDLEQIQERKILLTDSSLIYHPGYIHDPYKCRDQIERNFRLWFTEGRLVQTILYQP